MNTAKRIWLWANSSVELYTLTIILAWEALK